MAPRDIKNLGKDLKKALDITLRETVVSIESNLQSDAVSPTSTSRFRSNWMVAEGTPDRSTTEDTTPTERAPSLRITSDKEYWISNSLPYAQRLAIEGTGQRVVSKPTTWFTDFRNARIPKIVEEAKRQAQKETGF